jgi:pyruvate formate-lyase activating enzyme-like uncharacterized protein
MGSFEPECLTIGLGNDCNLDCTYCYGKHGSGVKKPMLEPRPFLDAIAAAAERVSRTCAHSGRHLTFGFQGMGEPFADPSLLEKADDTVRAVAARHHLPVYSYITSNGTMPTKGYRWAAERFDRICLSIDGPPRLHDLARRDSHGQATCAKVLETVALLRSRGKPPACRVTVTSENVEGMAEMAAFFFAELGVSDVQFEPVYRHSSLRPEPEEFVRGLIGAREIARRHGGKAGYAGYRPHEAHGPYCQTLRHVLFITRNGTASACLFREGELSNSPITIGAPAGDVFVIDQERIDAFETRVAQLPEVCAACAIRNHCTRGCPDHCPLDNAIERQDITASLGCRINRLLHDAEVRTGLPEILPEVLLDAKRELREAGTVVSNVATHLAGWQRYLDAIPTRLPSAHVADEGATVYLGQPSPGCSHCKQGSWDCIFVTHRCNLACSFCCSPKGAQRRGITSALGGTVDQMVASYLALGIQGISLTGGEPLLEPDLTFSLVETLRRELGDRYLWIYTNGLLLRSEHIDRLAGLGLNEIRFNTAATGYSDPIVLRTMARAATRLPAVTVEIPTVPGDARKIIDSLAGWSTAGVKYLNLHELMRERDSLSHHLEGDFTEVTLADGHVTEVSAASRDVALAVMEAAVEMNLAIHVNFCSFTNKLLQLRGRRKNLAVLRRQPHEQFVEGAYLETVLACSSREKHEFAHPANLERLRSDGRGRRLFLIRRTAPLSLDDPGRVIDVQEVG